MNELFWDAPFLNKKITISSILLIDFLGALFRIQILRTHFRSKVVEFLDAVRIMKSGQNGLFQVFSAIRRSALRNGSIPPNRPNNVVCSQDLVKCGSVRKVGRPLPSCLTQHPCLSGIEMTFVFVVIVTCDINMASQHGDDGWSPSLKRNFREFSTIDHLDILDEELRARFHTDGDLDRVRLLFARSMTSLRDLSFKAPSVETTQVFGSSLI